MINTFYQPLELLLLFTWDEPSSSKLVNRIPTKINDNAIIFMFLIFSKIVDATTRRGDLIYLILWVL